MTVSRNNHFVPQMYLHNWGTDNKIFVHRLLVPHEAYPNWERCAIRKTAYIENLYVRIEDGEEYDDFEIDFNSQFETPAKPILDMVCNGQKMTPENWRILCDYITAQYVRTPSFYHFVSVWGKGEVPNTLDSILKSFTKEDLEKEKKHDRADSGELLPLKLSLSKRPDDKSHTYLEVNTVVGKNLWLFIIHHILTSDSQVKQAFRAMKWSIVTAPPGVSWPTCDAPVVIAKIDSKRNLSVTDGIGNRDRVIIFPVSPSKVLWGMHKREFLWRFEADSDLADQIINVIVSNALMYVYSSYDNSELTAVRERTVDKLEFQRLQGQYTNWYSLYKKDEAPLLTRNRTIKHVVQEGLF